MAACKVEVPPLQAQVWGWGGSHCPDPAVQHNYLYSIIIYIQSLGAVCNVVRLACEALGSARAALVVSTHKLAEVVRCRDRAVAAVGTGVVHPGN